MGGWLAGEIELQIFGEGFGGSPDEAFPAEQPWQGKGT
jgi:hypothetical protein